MRSYHHKNFPIISLRQLEFILGIKRIDLFDLLKRKNSFYKPFVKKKNGKMRMIDNPTGKLKLLQSRLYRKILREIPLPDEIMGGIKGKSPKQFAIEHVDKSTVVRIDIKNFFPNISHKSIFKTLRLIGFSTEISSILTKLTTFQGHIPQGAPTSMYLANLYLTPMIEEIKKITEENGLTLKSWVDDIVISGKGADQIISKVIKIINRHGQAVGAKKIQVMRENQRQEVMGIVVNKKIAISKDKMKDYSREILTGETNTLTTLGRIEWVKNIDKKKAEKLKMLMQTTLNRSNELKPS